MLDRFSEIELHEGFSRRKLAFRRFVMGSVDGRVVQYRCFCHASRTKMIAKT